MQAETPTDISELKEAIEIGDVEAVSKNLQAGVDPNTPLDEHGLCAVSFTIRKYTDGSLSFEKTDCILDKLLQYGASVTQRDVNGCTCLHTFFNGLDMENTGAVKICSKILNAGFDHGLLDLIAGDTAFMCLCNNRHFHLNEDPDKFAHVIYCREENIPVCLKMARECLGSGADPKGPLLLHKAVENSCSYIVDLLLRNGASVNEVDPDGIPVLHAILKRREKFMSVLNILLDQGVDIDVRDNEGRTLLLNTELYFDKIAAIPALLEKGASPLICDTMARTTLHVYALMGPDMRGSKEANELVELFMKHGVDPNAKDICGNTALMCAYSNANWNQVKALLPHTSNINCGNKRGMTIAHYATKYSTSNLEYIKDTGIDMNKQDVFGTTPLHCAVVNKNLQIVKALIQDFDVNCDVKDVCGRTAYDLASFLQITHIIKYFTDPMAPEDEEEPSSYNFSEEIDNICDEVIYHVVGIDGEAIPGVDLENHEQMSKYEIVSHTSTVINQKMQVTLMLQECDSVMHEERNSCLNNQTTACSDSEEENVVCDIDRTALATDHDSSSELCFVSDDVEKAEEGSHADPNSLFTCIKYDPFESSEDESVGSGSDGRSRALEECSTCHCKTRGPFVWTNSCPSLRTWSFSHENSYKILDEHIDIITEYVSAVLHSQNMGLFYNTPDNDAILHDVENLILEIADKVAEAEPLFKFTPLLSGSMSEGTKIGLPDEYDYLCVLDSFSKYFKVDESKVFYSHPQGFLRMMVDIDGDIKPEFLPYMEGPYLRGDRVIWTFYRLVNQVLGQLSSWNSNPFDDILRPNISLNKTIGHLQMQWAGPTYKHVDISIDLVGCLDLGYWKPQLPGGDIMVENDASYLLVFKGTQPDDFLDLNNLFFPVSVKQQESSILKGMNVELKKAYMLLKTIVCSPYFPDDVLGKGEYMFDDDLSSYMLKLVLLEMSKSHKRNYQSGTFSVYNVRGYALEMLKNLSAHVESRNLESILLPGINLLKDKAPTTFLIDILKIFVERLKL